MTIKVNVGICCTCTVSVQRFKTSCCLINKVESRKLEISSYYGKIGIKSNHNIHYNDTTPTTIRLSYEVYVNYEFDFPCTWS